MSKRRVFDIDFPDDAPAPSDPAPAAEHRRGPMATAIVENADALAERSAAEAAIRAENDRLAHEHVRLKKLGLIIGPDPAGRDPRRQADPRPPPRPRPGARRAEGLDPGHRPVEPDPGGTGGGRVTNSCRGSGASPPIGSFMPKPGEDRFAAIPAGLLPRGESLDSLYRRMVDENLVRRDISFAEMGMLVLNYMEDHPNEADDAHGVTEDSIPARTGRSGAISAPSSASCRTSATRSGILRRFRVH